MRICLVAELPQVHKGGAETQCYMIAQGLSRRGHNIHYVLLDEPGNCGEDIVIHRVRNPLRNVRYLKTVSAFDFLLKMREADCDVYLQTCAGSKTGLVGHFCKQKRKPFIYRAATDWDADLTFTRGKGWTTFHWLGKKLYRYGLKNADVIVCNSKRMTVLFRDTSNKFGTMSDVRYIPNGQPIPDETFEDKKDEPPFVLWAARLVSYKHPELYVRLAESLPASRFVMAGKGSFTSPSDLPPNLEYLGFVSEDEKMRLFEKAAIFVSTSEIEGFPNTLIEAGMYSVPYVARFDPDGAIEKNRLGMTYHDIKGLRESVETLLHDEKLRREMSRNIRRYVEENHKIEKTVSLYEKLFEELAAK